MGTQQPMTLVVALGLGLIACGGASELAAPAFQVPESIPRVGNANELLIVDCLSLIDPDLLAANKRITNLALELMGAQTLQRLAGENDARAHRSQAVRNYGRSVKEHGLKETLRRRDAPFGDDRVRVSEPEGRKVLPRLEEQD